MGNGGVIAGSKSDRSQKLIIHLDLGVKSNIHGAQIKPYTRTELQGNFV